MGIQLHRARSAAALAVLTVVALLAPGAANPASADGPTAQVLVRVDVDCSDVEPTDCPSGNGYYASVQGLDGSFINGDYVSFGEASVYGVPEGQVRVVLRGDDVVAAQTQVTVTAPETVVDLTVRPQPSARVTVRVQNALGEVVGNGTVDLVGPDGVPALRDDGNSSDAIHTFTTRRHGTFRLLARNDTSTPGTEAYLPTYYGDVATLDESPPITLGPGSTHDLTVTLRPAAWISGTITGPVQEHQGVATSLYSVDGTLLLDTAAYHSEGRYAVGGLEAGTYLVRFTVSTWSGPAPTFYASGTTGSADPRDATPVTVVAGGTTPGVDVTLTSCSTLTGRIVGRSAGQPSLMGLVVAESLDDRWETRVATSTPADTYTIEGLAPGRYRVLVPGTNGEDIYYPGGDESYVAEVAGCGETIEVPDVPVKLSLTAPPAVAGTPSVGSTLTTTPGTWDVPGLSYAYAWFRDDVAVPGATGPTYVVSRADQGTLLSARVTASRPGYEAVTAPSAAVAIAPAPRYAQDWDGDRKNDVLAVLSTGTLRLYPGNGGGRFGTPRSIGSGWGTVDQVSLGGDFTGDHNPDLVARAGTYLRFYLGDGAGGFSGMKQLGAGWNVFSQVLAPGDFTGDRKPDLLAIRADNGSMWLYPGTGTGSVGRGRQISTGWGSATAVAAAGDVTGDGKPDLVARMSTGDLRTYPGNGEGGFLRVIAAGTGWGAATALVGVSDFDGDALADLLTRTSTGMLQLRPGTGRGTFGSAVTIGSGWNGIRIVGSGIRAR